MPLSNGRVRFAYRAWSAENAPNVSFRVAVVDSLTGQPPRGGVIGNLRAPAHVRDGQLVVMIGEPQVTAMLASHVQKALGATQFGKSAQPAVTIRGIRRRRRGDLAARGG